MGRLLVSLGALPVLEVPVREGITRIGRSAENDIVLSLPDVGDRHAEIHHAGGQVTVRSLDRERIVVNGRGVAEARLGPGDRVEIGGYRLRWSERDGEAANEGGRGAGAGWFSTATLDAEPGPGPGAPSRLVVLSGPDAGAERDLDRPVLVVGRAEDCDLVLTDDTVSWCHLSIERAGSDLRVVDRQSRNGTFLDGRRIDSAPAGVGARVRIGRTTLLLGGDRAEAAAVPRLAELTGGSAAMQRVYQRIRQAAASRVPALLLGETGTGKELAARAVHALSSRSAGPFVPINCAAIPREILEAELFGHARGAFTGAVAERPGAFVAADGGTLFLDEIAELPLDLQPKLLRVVESGEVPRLGGGTVPSAFRLIAATNRDLAREVAEGRFREDLYYRLAVFPIHLPPLRERPDDLPDLVADFLSTAEAQAGVAGVPGTRLSPEALESLRAHPWPGNVRELRNVILRAVIQGAQEVIPRSVIDEILRDEPARRPPPAPGSLDDVERAAIANALRDGDGNRRQAARRLGIAESTLYQKIRKYGLQR
jgi:transcriptional regulator with AAA-type ATPase domain